MNLTLCTVTFGDSTHSLHTGAETIRGNTVPKKVFGIYLMRGFQKYQRKWNSHGGFLRADQSRAKMCSQMGWIGCAILRVTQKSHRENSISFIFSESPHQVDMKHVFKSSKHFFGYFNALETLSDIFEVKMGCEVRSYTHTLLNSPYSRKNSRFHWDGVYYFCKPRA